MTIHPVFVKLARPGTTDWFLEDREEVIRQLTLLRGHAVILDEAEDHRGKPLTIRVHHYWTCVLCRGRVA